MALNTDRAASRLAWSFAGLAFAGSATIAVLAYLNRSAVHVVDDANPIEMILPIGVGLVGAVIASRNRQSPIGWIFLAIAVLGSLTGVANQYVIRGLRVSPGSLPGVPWAAWFASWSTAPIFPTGLIAFLFLLFPNGRLPSRRWRVLAWVAFGVAAVMTLLLMIATTIGPEGGPAVRNPISIPALARFFDAFFESAFGALIWVGGDLVLLACVVSAILRLRRSTGDERQQLKWFAYAGVATVGATLLILIPSFFMDLPGGIFDAVIILGFGIAIPVACAVAILKHGLYEIDVVISKTVLYALLAGFFTVVYVAIVVGIGAAVGSRAGGLLTVIAAVVIALAFQPIRERARRLANRMVYGKRATPYELLSDVSGRLAGAYSTEDVLPRIARLLVEGTGASRTEVWLRVADELRPAASWPERGDPTPRPIPLTDGEVPPLPGADHMYPVRHQGELLGVLAVAKPPNEPLSATEDRLLEDLSDQAGLVLRNVRLTEELRARLEDLRASRQRLVTAQDEERRRLERDIHDGAQQQLVALAVKLRLAQTLAGRDPEKATTMLTEAQAETQDALQTLRDLARGIFPPLLADQGLAVALASQARKAAIPIEVIADGIGRHPQEAESAVYFCCLEALQNAAKYAAATRVVVRLFAEDDSVVFQVTDDGRGFDPATTPRGSGLTNMSDRLEALGGTLAITSAPGQGTSITGRVPAIPANAEP